MSCEKKKKKNRRMREAFLEGSHFQLGTQLVISFISNLFLDVPKHPLIFNVVVLIIGTIFDLLLLLVNAPKTPNNPKINLFLPSIILSIIKKTSHN